MSGETAVAHLRYHPSAEQLELAGTIDQSLLELLPLSRLHASRHEEAGTWGSLEEIGVFTMGVGEDEGGSGLGVVEEALVVLRLGRQLASPGILATLAASSVRVGGKTSGAPSRVAAAYRHEGRVVMVEEPQASLVLLREAGAASLHERPAGEGKVLDERLWLAGLREVGPLGPPLARFDEKGLARLRLIDAAALAGMAQAALEMAVAYAGTRQQFGRPIGSFQAVKHHCADMAMAARCARDQVSFAAVALDDDRADGRLQAECAGSLMAGSAALTTAGKNIQIHGGIGFSDEADPHLFLKRAQLQIAIAGGLEASSRRIAAIPGEA